MNEEVISIIKEIILKETKPNPGDINEVVSGLFPSIYVMIATIGAFLVTLIILSKLLYGPIKKMMKKRHDFIQKNIDDSIDSKNDSLKIQSKAKKELIQSKIVAEEIISKTKKESEVIKQNYIEEGKQEAQRLIDEANIEINFKLLKMEETRNNDIIDMAMVISKKIIAKNVDKKIAQEYLDSYIKGE
jgi:F-type H+-transporting ATPase subunit b